MISMEQRARQLLNLQTYAKADPIPHDVGPYKVYAPNYNQYILRMLVKSPYTNLLLPIQFDWVRNLLLRCWAYQRKHFIDHPFIYLTIRSGPVITEDDDVWHVDGFSMRIPHLPEQNYLWSSNFSTQFSMENYTIPSDFNPHIHNIHSLFAGNPKYCAPPEKHIVLMDPYIVHRRSKVVKNRTMIRVSFVPILIEDDSNIPNPLIPTRKFYKIGQQTRKSLNAHIY